VGNFGNFLFFKCKFEKDCYFSWKTHQTFKTTKLKKQTLKAVEMLFVFAPNLLLYEGYKQQIGCKNKWGCYDPILAVHHLRSQNICFQA
jgi:hypothetical protein